MKIKINAGYALAAATPIAVWALQSPWFIAAPAGALLLWGAAKASSEVTGQTTSTDEVEG